MADIIDYEPPEEDDESKEPTPESIQGAITALVKITQKMSILAGKAFQGVILASQRISEKMEAVSPVKVLERGYSLVYRDGSPVTHAKDLKKNMEIEIHMQDGTIKAVIIE